MASSFDQVVASYHRARQSGQLFDTFYHLFLSKSPDIPPMFARTDFPHQKLMLRESILEMLLFAQTESGRDEILRLAERHRQLNVRRVHYDLWLDGLCEALGRHDAEFSPDLERMWREFMGKGIHLMKSILDEECNLNSAS
jgi:hemoglobin-like flavoprotein